MPREVCFKPEDSLERVEDSYSHTNFWILFSPNFEKEKFVNFRRIRISSFLFFSTNSLLILIVEKYESLII